MVRDQFAPKESPDMTDPDNEPDTPMISFGAWLLTQHDRGDWVDEIAAAARGDRTFPKP
jgi:hypothetical protein